MPAHEFEFGLDTPAFVTADESGQLGQQVWRWQEIVVGDVDPCTVFIKLDFSVRDQLGRARGRDPTTPESRAACPGGALPAHDQSHALSHWWTRAPLRERHHQQAFPNEQLPTSSEGDTHD